MRYAPRVIDLHRVLSGGARRRRACVAGVLALGAALWVPGLGAQDARLALRVWTLRLPGTELGLDLPDLDGDGRVDLAIAHMAAPTGPARAVSLFLQGPRGDRFPATPAGTWPVPPDACAFAGGDLDPAPGGELLFLCPGRVVVLRRPAGGAGWGAHELVEVARVEGFFDYPEGGGLPVWDLVQDLDGDGLPEVLVPVREGYLLLARKADAPLAARGVLEVPPTLRFGPAFEGQLLNRFLTSTSRLRRLVPIDLDGDGRRDLVAYRERGLARFLQRPDGSFPRRPDREEPLQTVSAGAGAGGERKGSDQAFDDVRLDVSDWDGDGRADLVALRTVGELGLFESLRTQVILIRGRADGGFDEATPAAVILLKGVAGDPVFADWDGDGARDLILSSYRVDMFTNVKRALFDSMSIEYQIHLRRPGAAPFAPDPDHGFDVSVPLEALEKRGGMVPVELRADVDGDGVRDLVRRAPEGGLEVQLGRIESPLFGAKRLGFDGDRPLRVGLDRGEPPRVVDLDGDGRDELILEPHGGDDPRARVVRVVGTDG